VVAAGESRWRPEALIALVELTDRIGDDADLIAAVAALDPVVFPAQVASSLHYLQGVARHRDGALAAAAASYRAVPYGTPRYFSARLRLSVALSESGDRDAARDVLVDLLATRPFGTRLQQQDARRIQALALLDLARLYYAAGRYAEAAALYAQVDADTPWGADAALESGWAALMQGDATAAAARGRLAAMSSFLPEGDLLFASAAVASVGCPAAVPLLTDFLDGYRSALDELLRTGRMSGAEQWDWWFGEDTTSERALSTAFFRRLLNDQPLAGAIHRVDRIERELSIARDQPPEWVESVGVGVIALLEADRQTAEARMHTRLAARSALLREELAGLMAEAEAMRSGCANPEANPPAAPPAGPASHPAPDTDDAPPPASAPEDPP
jgi:hypothetical protein